MTILKDMIWKVCIAVSIVVVVTRFLPPSFLLDSFIDDSEWVSVLSFVVLA